MTTLAAGLAAARLLGAAGFGHFALAQSTAGLGAALVGFGLPLTATRLVAAYRVQQPYKAYQFWHRMATVTIVGAVVSGLMAVGASRPIATLVFGSASESALAMGTAWWLVGMTVNNFSQGALMGTERFRVTARWSIVRTATVAIFLLVGLAAGGAASAVIACAVAESVVAVPMLTHTRRLLRPPRTAAPELVVTADFGEIFRTAIPVWGSTLSLQPALWFAQFLLAHSPYGYRSVGVFALAQRALLAVVLVPGSVATSSLPILTERWTAGHISDFRGAARKYARYYLWYS
ncbi:MAG: oligosaccharide flippase family protein, partial [Pseudonocardiaceae bacterium]